MPDTTARVDLAACRLCVIGNRSSGRKAAEGQARTIRHVLAGKVAFLDIRLTARGDRVAAMARQAVEGGFDVVLALGGDGTQAAVAGALAGSGTVMGVLPGGTFNYFARDLGIGLTVEEALETVLQGQVAPVDIGQVENTVFLNNVSLGIYPHILKTREGVYKRWGRTRIAAYWSVLLSLRRLRHPLQVTAVIDGQAHEYSTALLFVARSAYQLEAFGLEGADAVRDGRLALLIARARRPLPLLRSALRLVVGLGTRNTDFDLLLAETLTIRTDRRRPLVAHDGEKTRMHSPLRLQVRRGALRVLVPPGPAGGTSS